LVSTLLGPSDIPISSGIVSYAGKAPTIGTVIHRVADGAPTWQTNGAASIVKFTFVIKHNFCAR
jgi:hypothetical protein